MIYGIGIDIVSVKRLREVVERRGDRFLERVFTSSEIDYCLNKRDPFPSLSARFAAKEAMIKAIGGRAAITFKDMEVINDDTGRPFLNPGFRLRKDLEKFGIKNVHLSLSHERDYSIAFVILER